MTITTTTARSILFAALLTAGFAAPAFAQTAPAGEQAPRMEIDVQNIDLTTPQGLAAARHRVANAARAVCATAIDLDGTHLERSACVQVARTQGNQRLQVLQEQAMARAANRTLALKSDPKAH